MKMNLFNSIQVKKPKSNRFDLTHDVKMSGRMGNLMPCCLIESVPGDYFTIGSEVFLRFAPLIAPVMHRMDVTIHYFFVPNRILWENWQKFITNNPTGGMPVVQVTDALSDDTKKLMDYLGIPPTPTGGTPELVNALPLSAYQCIYNEYYRDQNLVPEVDYKLTDGINPLTELGVMRKRAWEHDYFTASLPFAQKGAAVDIPLGNVELKDDWDNYGTPNFTEDPLTIGIGDLRQVVPGEIVAQNGPSVSDKLAYDPQGTLQVTPTTINELRRAFKLQEWLEKNARGGTRYIEQILTHFGVKSSDARLQRPEYITGVKTPVVISEVLNTTGSFTGVDEPTSPPQGNMSGHGVAVATGYTGNYRVEEHGYIIGIMSIMPKTAYQQGIPRTYLKTDPLQYYWPSFANIGEQEVLNKEIYAYTNNGDTTWGYVPRYAEYKFIPNRVAGDFRTSLKYWHLGRIFANAPTLSQEFLEVTNEDVDRIFAVNNGDDNLYIQVLNKVSAIRPMPVFGTPML